MTAPIVLAEITFSGPRAGYWNCRLAEAFMEHITMAGQIWMDFFIPALAPDEKIEAAGIIITAAQARAIIRQGYRATTPLPIYQSGVRQNHKLPEAELVIVNEFTVPALEEVATSAHCGGSSCAYGFLCNCNCPHCGGARMKEF